MHKPDDYFEDTKFQNRDYDMPSFQSRKDDKEYLATLSKKNKKGAKMAIFAFKQATDEEARRMEVVCYVKAKSEKKARKHYKKIKGNEFPQNGFYAVNEIPKKEGKEIISSIKEEFNDVEMTRLGIVSFFDNAYEESGPTMSLFEKKLKKEEKKLEKIVLNLSLLKIEKPDYLFV